MEEQFKVQCDTLVGQAVSHGMALQSGLNLLLPQEDSCKLTSNISEEVRHQLGKEDAHRFFTSPTRLEWVRFDFN